MPTPPLAASCPPAGHFPLSPIHCCLHTPGCQVTSLSSLGALLHGLSYTQGSSGWVSRSSVLIYSLSWGAAPSPAPIPWPHSPGTPEPPARWLTRSLPLPCQGFFLCRTDGHKLFGNRVPSLPQPHGKMHHRSREQSPPGRGTAPFSQGQVKV